MYDELHPYYLFNYSLQTAVACFFFASVWLPGFLHISVVMPSRHPDDQDFSLVPSSPGCFQGFLSPTITINRNTPQEWRGGGGES